MDFLHLYLPDGLAIKVCTYVDHLPFLWHAYSREYKARSRANGNLSAAKAAMTAATRLFILASDTGHLDASKASYAGWRRMVCDRESRLFYFLRLKCTAEFIEMCYEHLGVLLLQSQEFVWKRDHCLALEDSLEVDYRWASEYAGMRAKWKQAPSRVTLRVTVTELSRFLGQCVRLRYMVPDCEVALVGVNASNFALVTTEFTRRRTDFVKIRRLRIAFANVDANTLFEKARFVAVCVESYF